MEYNRNNHNRRDYARKPYSRGPTQRGGNHNFNRHNRNQNWRQRGSLSRENYGHYNPNPWQNPERTFDDRGNQLLSHQAPQFASSRSDQRCDYYENIEEINTAPGLNPIEEKARNFIQIVLTQPGVRSKLIFLETVTGALQTLQGTVDYCQLQMVVEPNSAGEFVMAIDKEEIARGTFPNKQAAKNSLAEQAMEMFKKDCFYIIKKKVYEEVSTKQNQPKTEPEPQTSMEGSKAHQMMLKMGWGGKGLGLNEQGEKKTVAETINQNITRQGLGTYDIFKEINQILEDYAKSDKISLLRFDPDFSSEERAHIHKIAAKFGLKSKSEGKGDQRRITVTKKLHRGDLVHNLLIAGLENTLYKLEIPQNFEHLWNE